jgi:glycosyltransferase involved in cell wall biosynthesis
LFDSALTSQKSVAILMGTYNGSKYIAQQLDSLAAQSYENWRLIVSDDGSSDETLEIVRQYQAAWGVEKVEIRQGPKTGFAQNFLSMACDPSIRADYYAFCDQDDVWLPQKLETAISAIENEGPGLRAYGGRTLYANEQLKKIRVSPDFVHPTSFRNALVQSIAGGNTMVFNAEVKNLLAQAGLVDVPSHDWWTYLLVAGADGVFLFDRKPQVIYRQHSNALVGGNQSFSAKIERATMVINGKFKRYVSLNCAALKKNQRLMTKNNQIWLDVFLKMRSSHAKDRIRLLEICGLYRQTWRGTLTFVLAAFLRRL